ncbi:MAG: hypothetical protein GEV09_12060 [Pseudonocardiaceae bacterium]|nr:hypothetical protein [Pseudonocardiaceae bacterium]
MRNPSRRVLLAAAITGGMLLGGAMPALAAPDLDDVTDNVPVVQDLAPELGESDLTEVPAQESLTQPVAELVCSLTGIEVELLGHCPVDAAAPEPAPEPVPGKPEPGKPGHAKPVGDKKPAAGGGGAGDEGAAPVGGVETGAGGTADDGAGLLLPLGLLGGAALTGGAAMLATRRVLGDQAD